MRIVKGPNSALNAARNSRLNALIVVTLYLLRYYFVMNAGKENLPLAKERMLDINDNHSLALAV